MLTWRYFESYGFVSCVGGMYVYGFVCVHKSMISDTWACSCVLIRVQLNEWYVFPMTCAHLYELFCVRASCMVGMVDMICMCMSGMICMSCMGRVYE